MTNRALGLRPIRYSIDLSRQVPEIEFELLAVNYLSDPIDLREARISRFTAGGLPAIDDVRLAMEVTLAPHSEFPIYCRRALADSEARAIASLAPGFPESGSVSVVAHGFARGEEVTFGPASALVVYGSIKPTGGIAETSISATDVSGRQEDRVHCNACGHETKHSIVTTRRQEENDPVGGGYYVTLYTTYRMLECRGCGTVCLEKTIFFSEWNPGDEQVTYYPPQVSRREPEWFGELSEDTQALLKEVYTALHADSRSLAMMGARAVLDRFMVGKIGKDIGGFADKLRALEEGGHIGRRQAAVLQAALDVGSASAHRGHVPSREEAAAVMDIVENLLQLEVLGPAAKRLRKGTPQRPPR